MDDIQDKIDASCHQNLSSDIAQLVKSTEKGLLSVNENSESDFLELGDTLQQGYALASEVTKRALGAAQITGIDSDDNELSKVGKTVHRALEKLKNRREHVGSKSHPVKSVVDHLGVLNSTRGEIEIIAKYLRAVALNIFVETARSEISNKSFSIIAQEIKDLSEKIISIAKQIRFNSEDAKNRFMTIYTEISSGISHMHTLIDDAEKSVSDAIENTERLVNISYAAVKQAGAMSQAISRQVEKIVVGVQFHDNMRQRIEHIVAILRDVEICFSEPHTSSEGSSSYEEKLSSAYAITVLQSDQIDLIISEIEDLYQVNRLAFEHLIDEISQLEKSLKPTATGNVGGSRIDNKTEDPFAVLALALSKFQTLENQGENLVGQLHETYQRASQTASTLSGQVDQVHEISRDAHIKALNALIAANQLGTSEGRTLSTLAAEMKTLSNSAEDYVTRVEKIIGSIVAEVQDLSMEHDNNNEDVSSEMDGTSLNEVVINVSVVCSQMTSDSETICRQAEELRTLLGVAKSNLDFLPAIEESLGLQLRQLEKVKKILTPWAGVEVSRHISETFVEERYTMEKERQVHAQGMAKIADPSGDMDEFTGVPETEPGDEGVELFGDEGQDDGVELFDDEPQDDGVELFDDTIPNKADEDSPGEGDDTNSSDDDLDDNIELF